MRELQRNREFLIALERGTTVCFTVSDGEIVLNRKAASIAALFSVF